jgi:hypothetical protein
MKRSTIVLSQIKEVASGIRKSYIQLGQLLSEAAKNNYHLAWGYSNFREWLDDSGLDISERQAYYLINIVEKAAVLNIKPAKLEPYKISKLKYIFSLDPNKHKTKIKSLLKSANDLNIDAVKTAVNTIVGTSHPLVYSVTLTPTQFSYVRKTVNKIKKEYDYTSGKAVVELFKSADLA